MNKFSLIKEMPFFTFKVTISQFYDTEEIHDVTVHVEEGMDRYANDWRQVLSTDISRINQMLPSDALYLLSNVRIFIHKNYAGPENTIVSEKKE